MVYLLPTPITVGMTLFVSFVSIAVVLPWPSHGASVLTVTALVPQVNIGVEFYSHPWPIIKK